MGSISKEFREALVEYEYPSWDHVPQIFKRLVSEVEELEPRLTRVSELLLDNYSCYDKDGCKNCSGDADEIDYKSCVGYNVLTALRVEEKR